MSINHNHRRFIGDIHHLCYHRSAINAIQSPFFLVKFPFFLVKSQFFLVQSPFFLVKSPFFLVKSPFFLVKSPFSYGFVPKSSTKHRHLHRESPLVTDVPVTDDRTQAVLGALAPSSRCLQLWPKTMGIFIDAGTLW